MNLINEHSRARLFNTKTEKKIVLFNSASLLILSIIALFGGLEIILSSLFLFLIAIPIVSFFQNLSKIQGLINGYIFSVTIKSIFLMLKLIVLNENPISAINIGGDSLGYITSAFKTNIVELVLDYGIDLGYVFFLKTIVMIFDILPSDLPIVFVIPNIFASSLIVVFSVILCKKSTSSNTIKLYFLDCEP